jgi:putative acetyltransferase
MPASLIPHQVRGEQPQDREAIFRVNREAFGRETEARLVDALPRSEAFFPELSLVAVDEGGVVGHILFTRIQIKTASGPVPALALAPMAVLPGLQRQGIGSALVQRGLEECRRRGEKLVVVLGHPEYYPRFGFVPAGPHGIRAPFPPPPEAFMVLELDPGALEGVSGEVAYPPEFAET